VSRGAGHSVGVLTQRGVEGVARGAFVSVHRAHVGDQVGWACQGTCCEQSAAWQGVCSSLARRRLTCTGSPPSPELGPTYASSNRSLRTHGRQQQQQQQQQEEGAQSGRAVQPQCKLSAGVQPRECTMTHTPMHRMHGPSTLPSVQTPGDVLAAGWGQSQHTPPLSCPPPLCAHTQPPLSPPPLAARFPGTQHLPPPLSPLSRSHTHRDTPGPLTAQFPGTAPPPAAARQSSGRT
jgi:hypothetical protein